ncbi:type II toxin-antitoxin system Phd/YefM family antitoxin, partial [Kineococcus vitellinus]|uniref:type II toxin-antitoxin system Phd/YefM family antitoxin n=1 Tax=Kineococcus vitellinus TaxID=2696565 RepID=UPI003B831FF6
MRSINARELRNEYAKVLAEVEAGESFTILSRGRAVAHLTAVPSEAPAGAGGVPVGEGLLRRRAERRARFSAVRLGDAVGLNAAAGPFDHAAFARQQHAFWGEEVSDPYFGRADV